MKWRTWLSTSQGTSPLPSLSLSLSVSISLPAPWQYCHRMQTVRLTKDILLRRGFVLKPWKQPPMRGQPGGVAVCVCVCWVCCLPGAYINWVCYDFWPCRVSDSGFLFAAQVLPGKFFFPPSPFPPSTREKECGKLQSECGSLIMQEPARGHTSSHLPAIGYAWGAPLRASPARYGRL